MSNLEKRRTLDPEKTRQGILEAAFSSFSERGFAATSIGDIAKVAGVPKSLVGYHFGSKEELWQACLVSRAGPVIEQLDQFLGGNATDLGSVIEARFNLMRDNPELRRILSWASIEILPIPKFIEERRERLLARVKSKNAYPRVLLALAAMDGWFMFGGLYRRGLSETGDMDGQVLEQLKKMVSEQ